MAENHQNIGIDILVTKEYIPENSLCKQLLTSMEFRGIESSIFFNTYRGFDLVVQLFENFLQHHHDLTCDYP